MRILSISAYVQVYKSPHTGLGNILSDCLTDINWGYSCNWSYNCSYNWRLPYNLHFYFGT